MALHGGGRWGGGLSIPDYFDLVAPVSAGLL